MTYQSLMGQVDRPGIAASWTMGHDPRDVKSIVSVGLGSIAFQ